MNKTKLTFISISNYYTIYLPKFGFCFPAKIFKAVDLPIPFVPTKPRTSPGLGIGNLCNLKEFLPYLWVVSFCKLLGKLIIFIASNGHFYKIYINTNFNNCFKLTFTQIPQPIQSSSDIEAILLFGVTSIHNFPIRTTGHDFLHSWRHRFGLHLSELTIAILVSLSDSSSAFLFDIFFNNPTKDPMKQL